MHSVTNIFIFLSMCKIFISLHGLQTHLRQNVVHSFVKDKMKSVFIFFYVSSIYTYFLNLSWLSFVKLLVSKRLPLLASEHV